jgi:hypothetical protein
MEIIKLNVGGKKFTTLKSTLLKYKNSYLADLLEKEKDKIIYDENKAVFIDRNPKYFEFIIEYLRTGFMEALPQDFHTLKRLTDEALFYKLDGLSQEMYLTFLPSVILTQDLAPISKLFKLSDFFIQKWHLVYRGTRDGFGPNQFHEKCDVLKNSLIIAKTARDQVFGGYTNASWGSSMSLIPQPITTPIEQPNIRERRPSFSANELKKEKDIENMRRLSVLQNVGEFKKDPDAFIFSIVNGIGKEFLLKCINSEKAIYADQRCGPVFGNNDINLLDMSSYLAYEGSSKYDKVHSKLKNYSNVGNNYQLPEECEDSYFLAGAKSFDLVELEVFTASIL